MLEAMYQSRFRGICLIYFTGLLFSFSTYAANWEIEPTLEIGAAYTSNVFLAPEDLEESDYIGQINPGIIIRGEGRRSRLDLDYVMENLYYQDHPDGDNTYHHLRFFNANELLEDIFNLDLSAIFDQTTISTAGPVSVGNFALNLNRADFYSVGVSPYLTFNLGRNAYTELRYRYNRIEYTDPFDVGIPVALVDNESNTIEFLAASRELRVMGWEITYYDRTTDFETGTETRFRRGLIDLIHNTSSYFRILGGIGYEENNYATTSITPTEGTIWYAGAEWTPNSRTNLTLRAGERYFGPTQSASLTYTSSRTNISLSYSEEFRTVADLLDSSAAETPADDIEADSTELTDDVLLRKRIVATIGYTGQRSISTLIIYDSDDEYQNSGDQQNLTGFNFSWERSLTRKTKITLGGIWQNRTFFTLDREDNTTNARIIISHNLKQDVTGNLELYHTNRNSTDPVQEYTENLANIYVNFIF